ncbi:TATA binding protein-associated phospho protein [Rhodotorula sp. JG-1b]|nr:TATA binding protein-associated phospho protein [Rhodotorula sp. JG-1b]
MSDDESPRNSAADDEVALPKATVHKLVQEFLPAGFTATKEVKDLMVDCCKEFLLTVSSEANEICEKDSKKTMSPEHIVSALKELGFDEFVAGVEDVFKEHKELAKAKRARKAKKASGNGMTEEEMLRIQEELFAKSRARMDAGGGDAAATADEPKAETE